MKKYKILLTNDDGYKSEGLQKLCEALSENNEVYVVAPDSQRSATSHAIHFHTNISFAALNNYFGAECAFITDGSPADCVKFAALRLGVNFDLVISGPNDGDNLAYSIPYSGTVGAAEEGAMCGFSSVALSRTGLSGGYGKAISFVLKYLDKLVAFKHDDVFFNINVPADEEEVVGIKTAVQGGRMFDDYYVQSDVEDTWQLKGDKVNNHAVESDAHASDRGYITVTPLSVCKTAFDLLEETEEIFR